HAAFALSLHDALPISTFGDDEVLVHVAAAGVNRPDIFQRKGRYPAPKGVPADIPGLEIAGEIVEIGRNVTSWKAGDKVCAIVARSEEHTSELQSRENL